MLKSYWWVGQLEWGGGPCDFSVSLSPFGLDFGTLDLGLTLLVQSVEVFPLPV